MGAASLAALTEKREATHALVARHEGELLSQPLRLSRALALCVWPLAPASAARLVRDLAPTFPDIFSRSPSFTSVLCLASTILASSSLAIFTPSTPDVVGPANGAPA